MITNNEEVLSTSFTNSTSTLLEILRKGGWEQRFLESIFVEYVVPVFQNPTLLQAIMCSIIDTILFIFRQM